MINERDKTLIKRLYSSNEWRMVETLANQICINIREQPKVRESEWETIREVLGQEGKVDGIKRLLQEVYNIAHDK